MTVGDKLGTVRDTKNLYVYQMSLKRINCYHHSLWLSVNLVAKRIISYFRLIAFLLIFNPPPRNLRVKLETSVQFGRSDPILQYTFLAKIQNRTNKKIGMEILLLSKFFGHVIKNLDGSGFSHPSFWSCDQKLGW